MQRSGASRPAPLVYRDRALFADLPGGTVVVGHYPPPTPWDVHLDIRWLPLVKRERPANSLANPNPDHNRNPNPTMI